MDKWKMERLVALAVSITALATVVTAMFAGQTANYSKKQYLLEHDKAMAEYSIEFVDAKIVKYLGNDDKYISLVFENNGQRTIYFDQLRIGEGDGKFNEYNDNITKDFFVDDLAIKPGKTLSVPYAPLKYIMSKFNLSMEHFLDVQHDDKIDIDVRNPEKFAYGLPFKYLVRGRIKHDGEIESYFYVVMSKPL